MDEQKTFEVIKHYIRTSVTPDQLDICRDLARDHFQVRRKNDSLYADLICMIDTREAIPSKDCGAQDVYDPYLQTR